MDIELTEQEYVASLEQERFMYAWCLIHYGEKSAAQARAAALDFYPYEKPKAERGLVLHDEAWHWAMIALKGQNYWHNEPDLNLPSALYQKVSDAYEASVAK